AGLRAVEGDVRDAVAQLVEQLFHGSGAAFAVKRRRESTAPPFSGASLWRGSRARVLLKRRRYCPRLAGSTPAKARKSTMRKSPVTWPLSVGSVGCQNGSRARPEPPSCPRSPTLP